MRGRFSKGPTPSGPVAAQRSKPRRSRSAMCRDRFLGRPVQPMPLPGCFAKSARTYSSPIAPMGAPPPPSLHSLSCRRPGRKFLRNTASTRLCCPSHTVRKRPACRFPDRGAPARIRWKWRPRMVIGPHIDCSHPARSASRSGDCDSNHATLVMQIAECIYPRLDSSAPSLSMSMLRRILSLSVLYASVLLAGVPALSCADSVPMHDCCPPQSGRACQDGESGAPKAMTRIVACCAAGAQSTTVIVSAVPLSKIEKQQTPAPPALVVSLALHAAAYSPPHSKLGIGLTAYFPSFSSLYLSTGRLRL
jgi:hypothetical protein